MSLFGGGLFGDGPSETDFGEILSSMFVVGKLRRHFQSSQGQHQPEENKALVVLKTTGSGLPTIRSDLAAVCDKVLLKRINGEKVPLLSHTLERLTDTQKQELQRLA